MLHLVLLAFVGGVAVLRPLGRHGLDQSGEGGTGEGGTRTDHAPRAGDGRGGPFRGVPSRLVGRRLLSPRLLFNAYLVLVGWAAVSALMSGNLLLGAFFFAALAYSVRLSRLGD